MKNIITFLLLTFVSDVYATDSRRIGGKFVVQSVKANKASAGGGYTVVFKNNSPDTQIKKIVLETNYVHVGVEVGKTLRLSAEFNSLQKGVAKAKQVLVFLPTAKSHSPVWLLSKQQSLSKLTGAKMLDMHAPQSDYLLF